MARGVALLRGINVGGRRRVPMADLRALAAGIGLGDVSTYIQSGNLLFSDERPTEAVAELLRAAIEERFGLDVPVVVRSAARWATYAASIPFADARPERLHLALSTRPPDPGVVAALEGRATLGERIALAGDGIWIDYAGGAGRSKLTPAALDRAAGSPVTARNRRTVETLDERLRS